MIGPLPTEARDFKRQTPCSAWMFLPPQPSADGLASPSLWLQAPPPHRGLSGPSFWAPPHPCSDAFSTTCSVIFLALTPDWSDVHVRPFEGGIPSPRVEDPQEQERLCLFSEVSPAPRARLAHSMCSNKYSAEELRVLFTCRTVLRFTSTLIFALVLCSR